MPRDSLSLVSPTVERCRQRVLRRCPLLATQRLLAWHQLDYYLRPKLGFYAVKRELAPINVGTKRSPPSKVVADDPGTSADHKSLIEIWTSNLTLQDRKVVLILKKWDICSGELLDWPLQHPLTLPSNCSIEFSTEDLLSHYLVSRV